jgi:hypothetical protein
MSKEHLLDKIRLAQGHSDCLEFCTAAYEFLSGHKREERSKLMVWFFQTAQEQFFNRNDFDPSSEDLTEQLIDFSDIFDDLVKSLIDFFSVKGYSDELYYQKIWDGLESLLPDATPEEMGYCLYAVLWDLRTPYYELPPVFQLSDNRFNEIVDQIQPYMRRLDFTLEISKNKKPIKGINVEFAAQIAYWLECMDNYEQKAVFLDYFLFRVEKREDESKITKNANET